MKIALPLTFSDGFSSHHGGASVKFTVIEVDRVVTGAEIATAARPILFP